MAPSSYKDSSPRPRFVRDLPSPVPPHPLDASLTPERAAIFRQVLARRCGRLVVVLEECHDPHNATAVLRTCDCFGLHRVHVVAGRSAFKVNSRISQGSHRYLDVRVHADIAEAYADLRADGFTILVSDLAAEAVVGPDRLATRLAAGPLALVFGSEGFGISDAARSGADGSFLIPMAGFAQSLNLSVSVAVSLYALRAPVLADDAPGDLDPAAQIAWYDRWVQRQRPGLAARLIHDRRGQELTCFGGQPPGSE